MPCRLERLVFFSILGRVFLNQLNLNKLLLLGGELPRGLKGFWLLWNDKVWIRPPDDVPLYPGDGQGETGKRRRNVLRFSRCWVMDGHCYLDLCCSTINHKKMCLLDQSTSAHVDHAHLISSKRSEAVGRAKRTNLDRVNFVTNWDFQSTKVAFLSLFSRIYFRTAFILSVS